MANLYEFWKKDTTDVTDHDDEVNENMQDTDEAVVDDSQMKQEELISSEAVDEETTSPKVINEEIVSSDAINDSNVSSETIGEEPVSSEAEAAEDELMVDYTEQLTSIQESIAALQDVVENLQYNVSMLVQNQASASDVAAMRRENEAFRSDSNMKLMRRYGIDAMIKTYQAVCDKIFRINHPRSATPTYDGEKVAYEWLLKRLERQFKPLGIRLKRTNPGSEIDDSVMVVYGSEGEDVDESETIISTDVEELKETVKESVSPAFMWTIPSLIGDGKEWCMEPEKVCIYK